MTAEMPIRESFLHGALEPRSEIDPVCFTVRENVITGEMEYVAWDGGGRDYPYFDSNEFNTFNASRNSILVRSFDRREDGGSIIFTIATLWSENVATISRWLLEKNSLTLRKKMLGTQVIADPDSARMMFGFKSGCTNSCKNG